MTTTVHDKNASLVTSDSRWSCVLHDANILYIDDSGFEKMTSLPQFALVTAGDGLLIDAWKRWAKGDISNALPPVSRIDTSSGREEYISVCLIFKPAIVLFDSQVATIVTPEARFSGSGKDFAKVCWDANRCAKRAISSATDSDDFTGGMVKFVDLKSSETNLIENEITIDELHASLLTEGWVMDKATKEVTPIRDYKGQASIAKAFQDGSLVASAPTGDSKSPWTPEMKENLNQAVDVLRRLVG